GISVAPVTGTSGDFAFFVDAPSPPPTASNPATVSPAGATELVVTVRFQPEPDSSGNTGRFGLLTLLSNEPTDGGVFQLVLAGTAVVPAIAVSPSECDFTLPSDSCQGAKNDAGSLATF